MFADIARIFQVIVIDKTHNLFYDYAIDRMKGVQMATTTISSKYQIVIPKDVREKLHLKSGQQMTVVVKAGVVYLIPERPLESFKGFLKGMNAKNIREDKERQ